MKKVVLILGILLFTSQAHAMLMIQDDIALNNLGAFDGTFEYTSLSDTSATLSIGITNTSPVDNGGYLTALAFNNPFDYITGVSLTTDNANFSVIGSPYNTNSIAAGPFGNYDIGVSISSSFQGGGSPSGGTEVGETLNLLFGFTGINLDLINSATFFSADALSVPPADGEGLHHLVGRYRGFLDGGSDKVVGSGTPSNAVPEPSTMALFGMGLVGLLKKKLFV